MSPAVSATLNVDGVTTMASNDPLLRSLLAAAVSQYGEKVGGGKFELTIVNTPLPVGKLEVVGDDLEDNKLKVVYSGDGG